MTTARSVGALLVGLAVLALAGSMFAGSMMGGPWPGSMMRWSAGTEIAPAGGWVWSVGMAIGMLVMLAFWVAVLVGGALLVKTLVEPRSGNADTSPDAFAILRRRYAAGEIDQATFERMSRELGQNV